LVIAIAPVSADVLALLDHHLLDVAGTYGDPNMGIPSSTTRYGSSTTRARWRSLSTTRHPAVQLFTTESETVRRVREVCCRLDDLAGSGRRA